ncbi:MAG: serine hydrolase [Gammaproteobacteria bacterium]|nr:serine hydrolase [Gammaproteobacteria bacterium]
MARRSLIVLLLLAVVVNVVYWQDPWLWRRYASTFAQFFGAAPRLLRPNEQVSGDPAPFPVAPVAARSVSDVAFTNAVEFAQRFDSFALVVLHGGKLQHEWYADGWDGNSLTQSQSMHKSLQALLVGVAIENGDIDSADDPVSRYINEWAGDPRGAITLHQLMMMSSGLANYRFTLNPFTDDFRWLYSGNTLGPTLRNPLADWAPGTQFDYNNINSELLGTVIQRATGKRYAAYLDEKLWQPMRGGEARVWLDREDGDAFTSCCLMATARDWARVGQVMLNRGSWNDRRIVSGAWIDRMVEASPVSKWYGLQTWLGYEKEVNPRVANPSAAGAYARSEPFLADDVYYFSGRGAQRVYVVPSRELVIVRLGPALGPNPLKPGWDNAYLVNTIIRGLR